MIRLKKKVEEKEVPPQQSTSTSAISSESAMDVTTTESKDITTTSTESGQFKLLGIGGKTVSTGETKVVGKKRSPGEIRIQKDITDLDGGVVAKIDFPNPNDLTKFNVRVTPDSGCWSGATYEFSFLIPPSYPHEPPKVTCNTKIYHPNINLEGNVCLNILRDEWKPVLDINAVIYGLIYLFYEPNPDDPLNSEAAELYRTDKEQFKRVVRRTLSGGSHAGESFPKLI